MVVLDNSAMECLNSHKVSPCVKIHSGRTAVQSAKVCLSACPAALFVDADTSAECRQETHSQYGVDLAEMTGQSPRLFIATE